MARQVLRGAKVYNFVTNRETGRVETHGDFPEVKAGGPHQRNNLVTYDADDPELARLRHGAPVTWNDPRDEPVVGQVPVPPPPPPTPTNEENTRIRELWAKANAVSRRLTRFREIVPLDEAILTIIEWAKDRVPPPAAGSPMAQLVAKVEALKTDMPTLTQAEATEYEALKAKFPQFVQ